MKYTATFLFLISVLFQACRGDVVVWPSEQENAGTARKDKVCGFYLLNEGNMGSNKSTLDYYDFSTGVYQRNIYGSANPAVVKELGDVGNDLQIYGSRMWAVINCSNKIEVMNARTAERLGQVELANCRFLCFSGQYAYATSYAGPVTINPDYEQKGVVVRIDTATLESLDTCIVGFQPDGIAVADGMLFVANSGGYMYPNYESTVSVVDLVSFSERQRITVEKNLHMLLADSHGQLWVSSRGDYYGTESSLFCITSPTSSAPQVKRVLTPDGENIAVGNMTLCGDSLYVIAKSFSYLTGKSEATYRIIDVTTHRIVSQKFITDGTEERISEPYGIAVHPLTHEIFLADARNMVNPGRLFCFSPEGILQWEVRTGDIPAHFAFLWE